MTAPAMQPETTPTPPMVEAIAVVDYGTLRPPAARRRRSRGPRWLTHLVLLVACAAFVTPFLWILSTSLKTTEETMEAPPRWMPHALRWQNYWDLLRNPQLHFLLWTRNTLIVEVLTVTGTVLSSALV